MQRIAVISDTHIPERAQEIPDDFAEEIREADHVIHAGDFTTSEILDRVDQLADGSLTAVSGNMDPPTLALPETIVEEFEGVTVVVTHGTGSPQGYEQRVADLVRKTADESAIGIAGHTHEVLDTTVDGVRLLNPGSVTGADPADRETMMTLDIDAGGLEVTTHETSV